MHAIILPATLRWTGYGEALETEVSREMHAATLHEPQ